MGGIRRGYQRLKNRLMNLRLKQRLLIVNIVCLLIPLILFGTYTSISKRQLLICQASEAEKTRLQSVRDMLMQIPGNTQVRQTMVEEIVSKSELTTVLWQNGAVKISNDLAVSSDQIQEILKYQGKDSGRITGLGSKKQVITVMPLGDIIEGNGILLSIQPYRDIYKQNEARSNLGFLVLVLSIVPSVLLTAIFSIQFSNKLTAFQKQMHKTAAGEFKAIEYSKGQDEISELYGDLNAMIESIQHLISTVYEEQVQKEKLNSRQKDVEFKMLASQINPHFLYNTLETIRMKARCNGETQIEELVKMLAKIMRRNIQVGDNLVTLKSELELVEYYLKIQQYRFGERIRYIIQLNCQIEGLKIMPLIIQPLVENAFVHGLETKEGEGEIRVIVERTDRLRIHIIDDGVGMSQTMLDEIIENLNDYQRLDRSHIGLSNVNQRIKLLYGDEYGIYIESKEGYGTSVLIELPEDMSA